MEGARATDKRNKSLANVLSFSNSVARTKKNFPWKYIIDFSLCSLKLLFKFVDTMQDEWKLGHAGRVGYLDAIAELI